MFRKLAFLVVAIALIASTGIALAAGTPTWWNNPNEYSSWRQVTTSGTAANAGGETQLITIIFDVPNDCPQNAVSKQVWQQIEWTVVTGAASLSDNVRTVAWGTDACPASTSNPYNDLDSGNMSNNGAFAPTHGYANGWERSRTINNSSPGWSPQCERIYTSFQIEPASSLNYRLEVQSLCLGPNAVTLSDLQATSMSTRERLLALLRSWLPR